MPITILGNTTYTKLDFARRAAAHFAAHPDEHTFCDEAAGAMPIGGETVAIRRPAPKGGPPTILVFELPTTRSPSRTLRTRRPDLLRSPLRIRHPTVCLVYSPEAYLVNPAIASPWRRSRTEICQ
jgi:hypothetical protein